MYQLLAAQKEYRLLFGAVVIETDVTYREGRVAALRKRWPWRGFFGTRINSVTSSVGYMDLSGLIFIYYLSISRNCCYALHWCFERSKLMNTFRHRIVYRKPQIFFFFEWNFQRRKLNVLIRVSVTSIVSQQLGFVI